MHGTRQSTRLRASGARGGDNQCPCVGPPRVESLSYVGGDHVFNEMLLFLSETLKYFDVFRFAVKPKVF